MGASLKWFDCSVNFESALTCAATQSDLLIVRLIVAASRTSLGPRCFDLCIVCRFVGASSRGFVIGGMAPVGSNPSHLFELASI